ncbi:hypothetical protein [Pseudogemmobacter sp. W21_MBD1_M6]|uniref:hypothetical protein n=1 Tax=Pseudogemmobacter sp. W21_MBD1_M6 TaxID=3240271 RepID=UPI003F9AB66D
MAKRQPLSWIIRPESEQGPLNEKQMQKLAEDFDLSESDIRTLSQRLAYPLSKRFVVRGVLEVIKGLAKGPAELEKLIKELRHAEMRLKRAATLYSKIQVEFPGTATGVNNPNEFYKSELHDALSKVQLINKSLTQSATKHKVYFSGYKDMRRERDDRRSAVLGSIFDAWDAAGRNVSISTIGSSSERTGPLVNFTNAIVRCLTNPTASVNGETIWSEIKVWHSNQRYRSSVSITDD